MPCKDPNNNPPCQKIFNLKNYPRNQEKKPVGEYWYSTYYRSSISACILSDE